MVPLHVRVEVPDAPRIMVVWLRAQVMPVAGDVLFVRVIVPVKPFCGVRVIVDEFDDPSARTFTVVGLAVMI